MKNTKNAHAETNQLKAPRILTIAESDAGGAAGLQGDIKTILALGGYAATAITALTAHERQKITLLQNASALLVQKQLDHIVGEIGIDAIKIGFLQDEEIVNVVADFLERQGHKNLPVVVDPSIVSRSGKVLMNDAAIGALKRRLYLHTSVLTPNTREAEILGVMRITDFDDMRYAADMMRTLGVVNVVLKGGCVEDKKELYFVATPDGERIYQRPKVQTPHTLGAGNVLSSALAVNLAKDMDVFAALESALDFMHQTIVHSTGFGHEAGPVNHAFHLQNQAALFHPEEIKIYRH